MNHQKMEEALAELVASGNNRWLITGVAGFIGSNLAEYLLRQGQKVVGIDNFATGHRRNLDDLQRGLSDEERKNFRFLEADICDEEACRPAFEGVSYVLHQAALGSVPRSIDDPLRSHLINVDGTLKIFLLAKEACVKRLVYASSSAVYGDEPGLPKQEEKIGKPLSPYAVTKYSNELYASVFSDLYGIETVGLRYFNVFGPRQDPQGAYAAVIPNWVLRLLEQKPAKVHGDGETTRDFCYVSNVVQANILAALAPSANLRRSVFNIAVGERITLLELYDYIHEAIVENYHPKLSLALERGEPRPGDVRHSLADIREAEECLGYKPQIRVREGLHEAIAWYAKTYLKQTPQPVSSQDKRLPE